MQTSPTLEQLRIAQGLSREQAAGRLGTTYQNLWRIECKGQVPNRPLQLLMAQVYAVPEDQIEQALKLAQ